MTTLFLVSPDSSDIVVVEIEFPEQGWGLDQRYPGWKIEGDEIIPSKGQQKFLVG